MLGHMQKINHFWAQIFAQSPSIIIVNPVVGVEHKLRETFLTMWWHGLHISWIQTILSTNRDNLIVNSIA